MSDVPLGLMLSGGIDSALILALMHEQSSTPVETFTVGFQEDIDHNELAAARRTAALFSAEHREAELSVRDLVDLETLIWHLDEPVADVSAIGFLALSRLASSSVKVALSGQGADELFGGYRKYRAAALARDMKLLTSSRIGRWALGATEGTRLERIGATLSSNDAYQRVLAMSRQLLPEDTIRFMGPRFEEAINSTVLSAMRKENQNMRGDPVAETLFLDAQLGLVDHMLHYFDRMSMAASLEVRVPFLDPRVVEVAARVPSGLKVTPASTKILLRRVAGRVLPSEILKRPKVGFFRKVARVWLDEQLLGPGGDRLSDGLVLAEGFVDRSALRCAVSQYREGSKSHTQFLLAALFLETWLGSYVRRSVS